MLIHRRILLHPASLRTKEGDTHLTKSNPKCTLSCHPFVHQYDIYKCLSQLVIQISSEWLQFFNCLCLPSSYRILEVEPMKDRYKVLTLNALKDAQNESLSHVSNAQIIHNDGKVSFYPKYNLHLLITSLQIVFFDDVVTSKSRTRFIASEERIVNVTKNLEEAGIDYKIRSEDVAE